MAMPILLDIAVKITIKKMATTMIHSSSKPYCAPSLDVIVTLLGPKTRAAVIIPGPKTPNQALNCRAMDFGGLTALTEV